MPLYEYRCTACAREVEVMHGMNAPGPDACEACGGPMSKLLSSPAIHFKGSGWAKKDAASATTAKTKTGSASDGGSSSTSGDGAATGKDGGESSASAAASKAEPSTSTSTTSD